MKFDELARVDSVPQLIQAKPMNFSPVLLALAGYRHEELAAHPFSVTHRRLCLGALVIGSALTGGTLFGIAISRIDPTHPARFAFGAVAGAVYFCMLLAFDALFIVGAQRPRPWAIAGRIALSLLMTAFSSMTLDAVIAGKRLDAEIDTRRLDADLLARSKHGELHDLNGKSKQLEAASKLAADLNQRLSGDPTTPEFVTAAARAKAADGRLRTASAEIEPQLVELRIQTAQLRAVVNSQESADERNDLRAKMGVLRVRSDALGQRMRNAEQEASASATAVQRLRDAWRADLQARLEDAHASETMARSEHGIAQRLTEQGAAASRRINDGAFEANIVEQSAAFWSLASRDRAYLAVGVSVWLCCLTMEMLAVLVKLRLPTDAADEDREAQEFHVAARREAEVEFEAKVGRALREQAQESALRRQMAKAELAALTELHDHSIDLVVEAWLKTQRQHQSVAAVGPRAALDRNFEALQGALATKVQRMLEQMSDQAPSADSKRTSGIAPDAVAVSL